MELNQQEMQEFVLYIIEFAKQLNIDIQTEDELKAFAEQIGEEGMKQLYQQYLQSKRQAPKAKLGAKLNYLKKLKGECPEGETLKYFLKGGRICKECQKLQEGDVISTFKNKRKKKPLLKK